MKVEKGNKCSVSGCKKLANKDNIVMICKWKALVCDKHYAETHESRKLKMKVKKREKYIIQNDDKAYCTGVMLKWSKTLHTWTIAVIDDSIYYDGLPVNYDKKTHKPYIVYERN